MENKISCGIFSNIAPLYIEPLWKKLSENTEIEFEFITSPKGFNGIKTIDPEKSKTVYNWVFVRNIMLQNIIVYQQGLINIVWKGNFDVYIFLGEMYNITTWIASIIARIKKKKVIFWGHGVYGNEKHLKKMIRILFYKIPNYHFLYGNYARELMIQWGFNQKKLLTVYNSLDFDIHKKLMMDTHKEELSKMKEVLFPKKSKKPLVIFIGRLTPEKKLDLLLYALKRLKINGKEINCLLVGDGVEKNTLLALSQSLDLEESVYFYGSCYSETQISKLLMISDCCVSPGNVGLTAIHSMTFGIPVISHSNFKNQGPEAEVIINGTTGCVFEENNIESLSDCILHILNSSNKEQISKNCMNLIASLWNPDNQSTTITNKILAILKEHKNP